MATDVTYRVEVFDDLANWSGASVVQRRMGIGEDGLEIWQASYVGASVPKQFFRLRVSR